MSLFDDDAKNTGTHYELQQQEVQQHEVDSPVRLLNACSAQLDTVIAALGGAQQLLQVVEHVDHTPGKLQRVELVVWEVELSYAYPQRLGFSTQALCLLMWRNSSTL
jgi:hypothetical protein